MILHSWVVRMHDIGYGTICRVNNQSVLFSIVRVNEHVSFCHKGANILYMGSHHDLDFIYFNFFLQYGHVSQSSWILFLH